MDMTGTKVGRLTVIARAGSDEWYRALWLCSCECGNSVVIAGQNLRTGLRAGNVRSCGCTPAHKTCNRCKCDKPLADFAPNKYGKFRRHSLCRACQGQGVARWYSANAARVNHKAREWYAANRERRAEVRRKWDLAHRWWRRDKSARRRALLAPDKIPEAEWLELCAAYCNVCAYCGIATSNLTQDHIVALAAGGTHDITNIVPACQPCNSAKRKKPVLLFLLTGVPNRGCVYA